MPAQKKTLATLRRHFALRPDIPRRATRRTRLAGTVTALFVFMARYSFLIGGLWGGIQTGGRGFLVGTCAGAMFGFLIRRSLRLRRHDLKHGFFVRMKERGNGDHAGFLEYLIERLHGDRFDARTCRILSGFYLEMQRDLQSCSAVAERRQAREKLDQKVSAILDSPGEPETRETASDSAVSDSAPEYTAV